MFVGDTQQQRQNAHKYMFGEPPPTTAGHWRCLTTPLAECVIHILGGRLPT